MTFTWFSIYGVCCYTYSGIMWLYYGSTGLEGAYNSLEYCGVFGVGYVKYIGVWPCRWDRYMG